MGARARSRCHVPRRRGLRRRRTDRPSRRAGPRVRGEPVDSFTVRLRRRRRLAPLVHVVGCVRTRLDSFFFRPVLSLFITVQYADIICCWNIANYGCAAAPDSRGCRTNGFRRPPERLRRWSNGAIRCFIVMKTIESLVTIGIRDSFGGTRNTRLPRVGYSFSYRYSMCIMNKQTCRCFDYQYYHVTTNMDDYRPNDYYALFEL